MLYTTGTHMKTHTTTVLCERQHNQTHQHQVFCSLGFFSAFLLSYTCKHSVHAPPFPSLVKFFLTSGEKKHNMQALCLPLSRYITQLTLCPNNLTQESMYVHMNFTSVRICQQKYVRKIQKRAKFVAKEKEEKVSTLLIKFFPPLISFMRVGK